MKSSHLKAPQENFGVLVVSPLGDGESLKNLHRLEACATQLEACATQARQEAIAAARDFHREMGLPFPSATSDHLLLTGHQPELFHPGVWIKNFAAYQLAQKHGLTPMNVIVDTDIVQSTSIRVPVADADSWRVKNVSFAPAADGVPFEEFTIHNEAIFERFPQEIRNQVSRRNLVSSYTPIVAEFWRNIPLTTKNLSHRFSTARRRLEESWGCHNLEVPMSRLCQTESFARFACQLLDDLPRFHQVHNECLWEYRKNKRIRSKNHPFPELQTEKPWIEAPFWVWKKGTTKRERLFVHRTSHALELKMSDTPFAEIPHSSALAAWRHLESQGYKIRSRALTTTMFCRLFLADLFIHGIGGAIYDELTDEIIRRYFGVEPPPFMVVSGTLRLPITLSNANALSDASEKRTIRQSLRDLQFNPDRHLSDEQKEDPSLIDLLRQKQAWIRRQTTGSADGFRRFQVIHTLNQQLQPWVADQRGVLISEQARTETAFQENAILQVREYAYVLHEEADLKRFFQLPS